MRLKKLVLFMYLITSHAPTAMAAPGFLKPNDPSLPQAVVVASRSVFKVVAQGGRLNRVIAMSDAQQVRSAEAEFLNPKFWFQKIQLEFCKRTADSSCPIFDQMADGSAFLLGDGKLLYSNLHNFAETLGALTNTLPVRHRQAIRERLIGTNLFFALTDGERSLVDLGTENGRLQFFNPDPALLTGDLGTMNSVLGRLSDVVRVDMGRTLGTPLRFSTSPPAEGENVYLVGFPSATHDRKLVGAEDSDGESLRISVGKVITLEEWKVRTGNSISPSSEARYRSRMIFVEGDCEHGNSGGPLLNARGEVVGVFMALFRDLTAPPHGRICAALNTVDEAALNNLWMSLAN